MPGFNLRFYLRKVFTRIEYLPMVQYIRSKKIEGIRREFPRNIPVFRVQACHTGFIAISKYKAEEISSIFLLTVHK